VFGLTLAVFAVVVGKSLVAHHSSSMPARQATTSQTTAVATQPGAPKADFDAYYRPKPRPAAELLETAGAK
jgi:hypothetical protein